MRVKLRAYSRMPGGEGSPGQVIEVDDAVGAELLERGAADPTDEQLADEQLVETATSRVAATKRRTKGAAEEGD